MGNFLSTKKLQLTSTKKAAVKVTDVDVATLELKHARKRLVDQQKRQELLATRAQDTAAELLRAKHKDRALLALRKRKLHDTQIAHIGSCVLRIDEQLVSLETSAQQVELVSVLKTANAAIKNIQSQVKVEDVERLMDDSAESAQYLNEMTAVLSQSTTGADEAELDAELNAMADAVIQEQADAMPTPPKVPDAVKTAEPAQAATQAEAVAAKAPERIAIAVPVAVASVPHPSAPVTASTAAETSSAPAKAASPADPVPSKEAEPITAAEPVAAAQAARPPAASTAHPDAASATVAAAGDDLDMDLPDVPTKKVEIVTEVKVEEEEPSREEPQLVPA